MFTTRRVGTTGHEILDPDGSVIAWTADGYWAVVVVALLNAAETHDLERPVIGGDDHLLP